MKQIITLLLILFFSFSFAQGQFCGSDEVHNKLMQSNEVYAQKYIETQELIQNGNLKPPLVNGVYTIPVVFHIMHTGEAVGSGNNPSNLQISNYLNTLNQTFSATYPSFPDTLNGGIDITIQFALAQRDESCNATNGILRVNLAGNSDYVNDGISYSDGDPGISYEDIAGLSRWDNTKYMNIYIVNSIGGWVAGYAYLPVSGATLYDGMVIENTYVFQNDTRVVTHEMAHAFGVRHTFEGSDGSTCPSDNDCQFDGDFICDIQPMIESITCDETAINPCTGLAYGPLIKNYMNYSCANIQSLFTEGQKQKMLQSLINIRGDLLTSEGATSPPTIIPSIHITPTDSFICQNQQVSVTATTTDGGIGQQFQWIVNNVSVGSSIGVYYFSPNDNDVISCQLTSSLACATIPTVSSNSISMEVTPNVTPTVSISESGNFLCQGDTVFFNLSLDNEGANPIFQWTVNNIDMNVDSNAFYYVPENNDEVICSITSDANCPNPAIVLDSKTIYTKGYEPVINLSGFFISSNYQNGLIQWYNVETGIIENETNQNFTPTENGSYFCKTIVNGCEEASSNIIVFNILEINDFMDHISLNVFPNPSKTGVFKLKNFINNVDYEVYSLSGKIIKSGNTNSIIDISNYSTGIYYLKLFNEKDIYIEKILFN